MNFRALVIHTDLHTVAKRLVIAAAVSAFLLMGLWSCSREGPPEEIITEAKRHSQKIMEDYRAEPGGFEGKISLKNEFYDGDQQRYVLEYGIDTKFTSPLPETPTAYIIKEGQTWHYEFRFDRKYEFDLPKGQSASMN